MFRLIRPVTPPFAVQLLLLVSILFPSFLFLTFSLNFTPSSAFIMFPSRQSFHLRCHIPVFCNILVSLSRLFGNPSSFILTMNVSSPLHPALNYFANMQASMSSRRYFNLFLCNLSRKDILLNQPFSQTGCMPFSRDCCIRNKVFLVCIRKPLQLRERQIIPWFATMDTSRSVTMDASMPGCCIHVHAINLFSF